jgi:hypothetical protein
MTTSPARVRGRSWRLETPYDPTREVSAHDLLRLFDRLRRSVAAAAGSESSIFLGFDRLALDTPALSMTDGDSVCATATVSRSSDRSVTLEFDASVKTSDGTTRRIGAETGVTILS